MIDEISTKEWMDWQESIQELEQLKKFQAQWNAPQRHLQEIWKIFRLLPLQPAYLIASHYMYDQAGWILTTKWRIFNQFDKALHKGENPSQITFSIRSAIETQQKIVALQKVFATLKDSSKTLQDRVSAYQNLKVSNPDLYQDIIHKIWIAKGSPAKKEETEIEITQ